MGVQLSWQSVCLTSRTSAVRVRLPPVKVSLVAQRQSNRLLTDLSQVQTLPGENLGLQLSGLEHVATNYGVRGSNPFLPDKKFYHLFLNIKTNKTSVYLVLKIVKIRAERLELSCQKTREPKSRASTNFTTPVKNISNIII